MIIIIRWGWLYDHYDSDSCRCSHIFGRWFLAAYNKHKHQCPTLDTYDLKTDSKEHNEIVYLFYCIICQTILFCSLHSILSYIFATCIESLHVTLQTLPNLTTPPFFLQNPGSASIKVNCLTKNKLQFLYLSLDIITEYV